MVIEYNVATAVKNFLENYAEIHDLPSPDRSDNRIMQSVIFLPAETTYCKIVINSILLCNYFIGRRLTAEA